VLRSARLRLTAWHVGVLALLLTSACFGLYTLLRYNYFDRADGVLTSVDTATVSMLAHQLSESGLDELAARDAVQTLNFPEHTLSIFDAQGDLLAEKPVGSAQRIPLPAQGRLRDDEIDLYTTRSLANPTDVRRVAALRVTLNPMGRSYVVVSSRSLTPLLGELYTDRLILFLAVPGGLLIAGLAAWFLVRITLLPVTVMAEQARRIGAENLEQRLPVAKAKDEFSQLAGTFNDLLSRLSAAFTLQRQFVADASHELRTPLSVIRTAAAVTLQPAQRTEFEYREALDVIDRQAQRLTRMVDDMFKLARADAGGLTLELTMFYLDEVLEEAVRTVAILAGSKNIVIRTHIETESLCQGDSALLRQLFVNLLDNAVKYTQTDGSVDVGLEKKADRYVITVRDSGLGISAEHREKVFNRFFRVDAAYQRANVHNVHTSGAGLGLSIALSIADTHRGTLHLESSNERGSLFIARIPCVQIGELSALR
jgi:two-component system OmpR family sensor kinase